MHSIRTRIIAITVAAILASVLAFAALTYMSVGEESSRSSAEEMNLIARNVQQELDEYLASIRQSVEIVAHLATDQLDPVMLVECGVAGSAAGEPRTKGQAVRMDKYLQSHCEQVEEAFSSVAKHTSGVVTYYYCIAAEVSEQEHGFFWSRVGETGFVEQAPLVARDLDPEDIEHTTWYYTPIRRGRPSWVGPYKAHYLNETWTVSYLAPIYKAGSLIGVLGMNILFETMQEKVEAVRIYDTGYACILTEEGTVLAHPYQKAGINLGTVLTPEQKELVKRDNSGSELFAFRDPTGEDKQFAFATLSDGMKLVVVAPNREINASWHKLMTRIILLALGIMAAFALFTAFIVSRLTKPLRQLSRAAEHLSAGEYDVKLDYSRNDEVGRLTASFREMRDHMKLYISDLNSKAYSDALTGVKNKAAFDISAARTDKTIREAETGKKPVFSLVMFDCNELKEINDKYGHEFGDINLQKACRMICRIFAHSPVFRLGGDEFAAMLSGHDYEARFDLLKEFDRQVEAHNGTAENPWEKISMAKGIADYNPLLDRTVEQVLNRADHEMYEEKRKHKERLGRKPS